MKFKSIAFHHFGCKVNFAEASALSRKFEEKGVELKDFHEVADVYVISSCVVTAVAEKKCRAAIRQARRLNPGARVAVIGCFSELKPGELSSMDGVDLVLGHNAKFNLVEELSALGEPLQVPQGEATISAHDYHGGLTADHTSPSGSFISSYSSGDRTRSFLKVQDGCDYYCSYCAIPLARGRSRSDTISHALEQAKEIVSKGIREIVLTGVNLGDFGKHNNENFPALIRALDELEGIERFRISSIEPDLLSEEIISFVATSKSFLPHFHIPLQSGSNKILKAMHRKYNRELYYQRVERIRELMPDACIAADVIVGFPGETREDFMDTYQFLNALPISYLHVFTYSVRENTVAARNLLPMVADKEKKERSILLHQLSEEKKRSFYLANQGKTVRILFESDHSDGYIFGFSENYIRAKTKYDPALVNEIVTAKLDQLTDDGVFNLTYLP